jgi:hypothetical protein
MNFFGSDNFIQFCRQNYVFWLNLSILALTMMNFQKNGCFTTRGMESVPMDQMTLFFDCMYVFFAL